MTDSTVSANLPQREPGEALKAAIKQVRVSELMRGDWVSAGFLHDRNAVEVLTVEAYNDDHDGVFCKVLGRFHAEGEPSMFTRYASDAMLLADDEEIKTQQALWRRSRVVAHLNRVARLIQDDELPVGGPSDPVRISLRLNDVGELHRLAAILGAQVKTDGVEFTVMWPATEREAASAPVEVVWRAYRSDIAANPLGTTLDEAKFSDNPWTRAAAQAYEDDGFGFSREPESYVGTAPVPDHVDGMSMTGREVGSEPHPSWPIESELKPWGSLDPAADRDAESVKRIPSIDPDSSMEAHYDAEIEAGQ